MRIFGRRSGPFESLEHDLRHNRPQPRDGVVDEVLTKIADAPAPRHPRSRLGLALAFTLVTAVAFGAFGGLGYAKSAAASAASSTKGAVSSVVKSDNGKQGNSGKQNDKGGKATDGAEKQGSKPGQDQYNEKVLICHRPPGNPSNSHTLSVPQSAVPAHLAHGDSLGPCANDKPKKDK